jgi:hypothetical protein
MGKKDSVTGGFGELLNTGRDVDGVTDQSELELASPADGAAITLPVLMPMPMRSSPPNRWATRR